MMAGRRYIRSLLGHYASWNFVAFAAIVTLVGATAYTLQRGGRLGPIEQQTSGPIERPSMAFAERGARETYDVINADNLFKSDRRPFRPVDTSPRATPPPTPTPVVTKLEDVQMRVFGVLTFPRNTKVFLETKDPKTKQVEVLGYEVGDFIGPFKIVRIAPESATFERGNERFSLAFDRFGEEGVFESAFQQAMKKYDIAEDEELKEVVTADGDRSIVREVTISGSDMLQQVSVSNEALVKAAEEGKLEEMFSDAELTVSGYKMTADDVLRTRRGPTQGGTVVISGQEITLQPGQTYISGVVIESPGNQNQGGAPITSGARTNPNQGGSSDGSFLISGSNRR